MKRKPCQTIIVARKDYPTFNVHNSEKSELEKYHQNPSKNEENGWTYCEPTGGVPSSPSK